MEHAFMDSEVVNGKLSLKFLGEFDLYLVPVYKKQIEKIELSKIEHVSINLTQLKFIDSAAALFLHNLQSSFKVKNISVQVVCLNKEIVAMIKLVANEKTKSKPFPYAKESTALEKIGKKVFDNYRGFLNFIEFLGKLFIMQIYFFKSIKNIRFKEIAFEIDESAIKAIAIVALTSFLIGLVVAYQSAYQLKIYGANIFIIDALGLSILRELSPLITAIVIAGRSGSAFTAQIGAMKITEELDAMRTMGFDPYIFLVFPRIFALMITMPILIFISEIMAIFGGMLIANIDLDISFTLFLERFRDVIAAKHFFVGIVKGPFFAFLIATIGIYRGLLVKDDTLSIGLNTTKSVVESIFAVIVCDAVFSIASTNLGI